MNNEPTLSTKQRAIAPVAASTATGDIEVLNAALERGLDVGLSISDVKEILVLPVPTRRVAFEPRSSQ